MNTGDIRYRHILLKRYLYSLCVTFLQCDFYPQYSLITYLFKELFLFQQHKHTNFLFNILIIFKVYYSALRLGGLGIGVVYKLFCTLIRNLNLFLLHLYCGKSIGSPRVS